MAHSPGGTVARVVAVLLLTLGLVGMHQMTAAAHAPGHGSAAMEAAGHGHDTGEACDGDDPSGLAQECSAMGATCLAMLNDPWGLPDPAAGPLMSGGHPGVSAWRVAGGGAVRRTPDLTVLQVLRT